MDSGIQRPIHIALRVCFVLVLLIPGLSESKTHSPESLASTALENELYLDLAWLALGHYRQPKLSSKWVSDVDDASFFLAPTGATDPAAELSESITALFTDSTRAAKLRCQFPARWHWLQTTLNHFIDTSAGSCTDFERWRDEIGATAATLVFPAAYLDSPSSMFGHTLLRLDKSPDLDQSGLLSHSVSYAAQQNQDDSQLSFIYRGLVGGYPGDTAVLPYYLKIREYSEIESRDIWEYRLRLNDEQILQIVRHLWEIKDVRIDYYFFSENCSFRLLALLGVVLPEYELSRQFPLYTIPVATVRNLYQQNLIEDAHFRPSVITRFNHMRKQLSSDQQKLAHELALDASVIDTELAPLSDKSRARVLDVAYAYSRLLPESGGNGRSNSLQLLAARSSIDANASFTTVPTPTPRDDQGHESERFSFGLGVDKQRDFASLEIRPAYHDLTDPAAGYPIGSKLEFSSGTLRYFTDGELQVEDYRLISIASIKARNFFFKPTSWAVQLGADRDTLDRSQRLTPNLFGQLGYAWQFGENWLGYGLIGAEVSIGSRLTGNLDIAARPQAGLLWRGARQQAHLSVRYRDSVLNGFREQQQVSLDWVANINSQFSLAAKARLDLLVSDDQEYSLSLQYFY